MIETATSHPVLLYDGQCRFCARSVRLILQYDKRKTLRFAALQGNYAKSIENRHRELRGGDSLVYVEHPGSVASERVYVRSDATLRIVRYLGGLWNLALAAYIIPRPIRDFLYDQFAKRRYRWFGKSDNCLLPPPDVRARFLD